MTKRKDFKKLVRERMKKTGESYAAAFNQLSKAERDNLSSPPDDSADAHDLLRASIERLSWMRFHEDYEPGWAGPPPLFEELLDVLTRDVGPKARAALLPLWERAVTAAATGDGQGCAQALGEGEKVLAAYGWEPEQELPWDYESEGDASNEVSTILRSKGEDFVQLKLQVGRTYLVERGPHKGRQCTILLFKDSFHRDQAWVRFADNGRQGEVSTEHLVDPEGPNLIDRKAFCPNCGALREEQLVLKLTGALQAAVGNELDRLLGLILIGIREKARQGNASRTADYLSDTLNQFDPLLKVLGRSLVQQSGRVLLEPSTVQEPTGATRQLACIECEELVETGTWLEGTEVDEITNNVEASFTMLVTSLYKYASEGKAASAGRMMEQALRQLHFCFEALEWQSLHAEDLIYREIISDEWLRTRSS